MNEILNRFSAIVASDKLLHSNKIVQDQWIKASMETKLSYGEIELAKTIAIICDPRFDSNELVSDLDTFIFDVVVGSGRRRRQWHEGNLVSNFLVKEYGVQRIEDLAGKPILVIERGANLIWLEPFVI